MTRMPDKIKAGFSIILQGIIALAHTPIKTVGNTTTRAPSARPDQVERAEGFLALAGDIENANQTPAV